MNPRFNGRYLHAYECGGNMTKMIINNLNDIINESVIGLQDEGIYMMKFTEVRITRE